MRIKLFILLFMIPLFGSPCGNEYENNTYTAPHGSLETRNYPVDEYQNDFINQHDQKAVLKKKIRLEKDLRKSSNYQKRSDYALTLLKAGEVAKGLEILQNLIRKHPNEYNIVANLGTAYELNGQNDSALKYISRAVRINPESHQGSEWIHVKILEAKIKMEKDPDFLKKNSILSTGAIPGTSYKPEDLKKFEKIKKELIWQLKERTAFIPPTDPVVADLLLELGNLVAVTEYLEPALNIYNRSLSYGPSDPERVELIKSKIISTIRLAKFKRYSFWAILILSVPSGITWWIIKRKNKRKLKEASSL